MSDENLATTKTSNGGDMSERAMHSKCNLYKHLQSWRSASGTRSR